MKKRILSCVLAFLTAFGVYTAPKSEATISVTVNGAELSFPQPPVAAFGRTLVPVREIFEALGATVIWNGETSEVTATKDLKKVGLKIGDAVMTVEDGADFSEVMLDVPAEIINGKTMVPVRAISEAFGCHVIWDAETQTVKIASGFIGSMGEASYYFNNELALICAGLSEKIESVYASDDVNKIKDEYKKLKIAEENIFTLSDNYESYYYSLACLKDAKINGENYNILFITARGTGNDLSKSQDELLGASLTFSMNDFFSYGAYGDSYKFYTKIFDGIENKFLPDREFLKGGKLKVVITGHSLGGSAANLVAAAFDKGIETGGKWWSGITTKDDIYCYTFGGIGSIDNHYFENKQPVEEMPIAKGFENIHNVFNYYDSFGPNPTGEPWPILNGRNDIADSKNTVVDKKFGHNEVFGNNDEWKEKYKDIEQSTNHHSMQAYIDALEHHAESSFVTCN